MSELKPFDPLLRDITDILNVDVIAGFRIGQEIVCWNCLPTRADVRRSDIIRDGRMICDRCKGEASPMSADNLNPWWQGEKTVDPG